MDNLQYNWNTQSTPQEPPQEAPGIPDASLSFSQTIPLKDHQSAARKREEDKESRQWVNLGRNLLQNVPYLDPGAYYIKEAIRGYGTDRDTSGEFRLGDGEVHNWMKYQDDKGNEREIPMEYWGFILGATTQAQAEGRREYALGRLNVTEEAQKFGTGAAIGTAFLGYMADPAIPATTRIAQMSIRGADAARYLETTAKLQGVQKEVKTLIAAGKLQEADALLTTAQTVQGLSRGERFMRAARINAAVQVPAEMVDMGMRPEAFSGSDVAVSIVANSVLGGLFDMRGLTRAQRVQVERYVADIERDILAHRKVARGELSEATVRADSQAVDMSTARQGNLFDPEVLPDVQTVRNQLANVEGQLFDGSTSGAVALVKIRKGVTAEVEATNGIDFALSVLSGKPSKAQREALEAFLGDTLPGLTPSGLKRLLDDHKRVLKEAMEEAKRTGQNVKLKDTFREAIGNVYRKMDEPQSLSRQVNEVVDAPVVRTPEEPSTVREPEPTVAPVIDDVVARRMRLEEGFPTAARRILDEPFESAQQFKARARQIIDEVSAQYPEAGGFNQMQLKTLLAQVEKRVRLEEALVKERADNLQAIKNAYTTGPSGRMTPEELAAKEAQMEDLWRSKESGLLDNPKEALKITPEDIQKAERGVSADVPERLRGDVPKSLIEADLSFKKQKVDFESDIDKALYVALNPKHRLYPEVESFLSKVFPGIEMDEIRQQAKIFRDGDMAQFHRTSEGDSTLVKGSFWKHMEREPKATRVKETTIEILEDGTVRITYKNGNGEDISAEHLVVKKGAEAKAVFYKTRIEDIEKALDASTPEGLKKFDQEVADTAEALEALKAKGKQTTVTEKELIKYLTRRQKRLERVNKEYLEEMTPKQLKAQLEATRKALNKELASVRKLEEELPDTDKVELPEVRGEDGKVDVEKTAEAVMVKTAEAQGFKPVEELKDSINKDYDEARKAGDTGRMLYLEVLAESERLKIDGKVPTGAKARLDEQNKETLRRAKAGASVSVEVEPKVSDEELRVYLESGVPYDEAVNAVLDDRRLKALKEEYENIRKTYGTKRGDSYVLNTPVVIEEGTVKSLGSITEADNPLIPVMVVPPGKKAAKSMWVDKQKVFAALGLTVAAGSASASDGTDDLPNPLTALGIVAGGLAVFIGGKRFVRAVNQSKVAKTIKLDAPVNAVDRLLAKTSMYDQMASSGNMAVEELQIAQRLLAGGATGQHSGLSVVKDMDFHRVLAPIQDTVEDAFYSYLQTRPVLERYGWRHNKAKVEFNHQMTRAALGDASVSPQAKAAYEKVQAHAIKLMKEETQKVLNEAEARGLIKSDTDTPLRDWANAHLIENYFPLKTNVDKLNDFKVKARQQGLSTEQIREVIVLTHQKALMRGPEKMDKDLAFKLANLKVRHMEELQTNFSFLKMTGDNVEDLKLAMRKNGTFSEEEIQLVERLVPQKKQQTGQTPTRPRLPWDLTTELEVPGMGNVRLMDFYEEDYMKLMTGWSHSFSGDLALAHKGILENDPMMFRRNVFQDYQEAINQAGSRGMGATPEHLNEIVRAMEHYSYGVPSSEGMGKGMDVLNTMAVRNGLLQTVGWFFLSAKPDFAKTLARKGAWRTYYEGMKQNPLFKGVQSSVQRRSKSALAQMEKELLENVGIGMEHYREVAYSMAQDGLVDARNALVNATNSISSVTGLNSITRGTHKAAAIGAGQEFLDVFRGVKKDKALREYWKSYGVTDSEFDQIVQLFKHAEHGETAGLIRKFNFEEMQKENLQATLQLQTLLREMARRDSAMPSFGQTMKWSHTPTGRFLFMLTSAIQANTHNDLRHLAHSPTNSILWKAMVFGAIGAAATWVVGAHLRYGNDPEMLGYAIQPYNIVLQAFNRAPFSGWIPTLIGLGYQGAGEQDPFAISKARGQGVGVMPLQAVNTTIEAAQSIVEAVKEGSMTEQQAKRLLRVMGLNWWFLGPTNTAIAEQVAQ